MIKFFPILLQTLLKIALWLKETAQAYELIPVDTRKREQHHPGFTKINTNTNTRKPAMLDGRVCVFDSKGKMVYWPKKWGSLSRLIQPRTKQKCCRGWYLWPRASGLIAVRLRTSSIFGPTPLSMQSTGITLKLGDTGWWSVTGWQLSPTWWDRITPSQTCLFGARQSSSHLSCAHMLGRNYRMSNACWMKSITVQLHSEQKPWKPN